MSILKAKKSDGGWAEIHSVKATTQSTNDFTQDATATADDIAQGVTAYAKGIEITGTIPVIDDGVAEYPDCDIAEAEEGIYVVKHNDTKYIRTAETHDVLWLQKYQLGDATTDDVISGKVFTSANGLRLTGTYVPTTTTVNLQTKTVDSTTYTQIVQPDSGYDGLSRVTVNPIAVAELQLPSMSVNADGNVYATAQQSQGGYIAAGSRVTNHLKLSSAHDPDFVASNIKNGVTIFGLTGTLEGGSIDDFFPVAPFTYTVDAIPNTSYGFAMNASGYYESQNKAKTNSYAICRVNFNVKQTSDIVFDVINFAEAGYDYGLLGNLDTGLTLSTSADSNVKKNFQNSVDHSASVVHVTYAGVTPGSHFVDVKFIKDSSQNKNNDSIQFKIQNTSAALPQETLDHILQADTDLVPENIKAGVDIFGVIGTLVEGGGLPAGIDKIDAGSFTLASDQTTAQIVHHELGVAPDIAVCWADTGDADVPSGYSGYFLYSISFASNYTYSGRTYNGINSTIYANDSNVTTSIGATQTRSDYFVAYPSRCSFKAGVTHHWVVVKFE